MPWIGNRDFTRWQSEEPALNETIKRLAAENEKLRRENVALMHDIDMLKVKWDYDLLRAEKLELDHARLQDDFKSLVALTAGRIPPKAAPEFDKDIWAEDERQPVVYLSPDPDDIGISGEEILRDIENARMADEQA